jgi:hypothetical protein
MGISLVRYNELNVLMFKFSVYDIRGARMARVILERWKSLLISRRD